MDKRDYYLDTWTLNDGCDEDGTLRTMALILEELVHGKGAFSIQRLEQIQAWIDEDWESCDYDREIIVLIKRLLITIKVISGR